ncbi:hypothetical protein PVAP13_2NG292003 [Panicum virgatum]|uniref:Uncharacterized protein n=1 Tax=Panicum virgatum TaxID=38727 RepID=A0A8T0VCN6_PANVG|nr:hypothetical protein PVAP13_2NG292003 [Panicum virgatum]
MQRKDTLRASRRYIACISSMFTQKSSSPRKKSWSRYLTTNILISFFDFCRYHLWKLYIYVLRSICSSSVIKGFPCSYGTPTTLGTGISSILPSACSHVNPIS